MSAGEDGSVRLWDAPTGAGQVLYVAGPPATDVAFSPDGSQIMGVGDDGRIRFWNASDGSE